MDWSARREPKSLAESSGELPCLRLWNDMNFGVLFRKHPKDFIFQFLSNHWNLLNRESSCLKSTAKLHEQRPFSRTLQFSHYLASGLIAVLLGHVTRAITSSLRPSALGK
jgi:hypothetical protein